MRWLALGALLGGCAQIFGIDVTTGSDAMPPGASLRFTRLSVCTRVIANPQDLTGMPARFEISNGTSLIDVPAMQSALDTWSADVEGTPAIYFALPDYPTPINREYAIPARAISGTFTQLEHPTPTPAAANAMLAVNVNIGAAAAAADAFTLYTLGSWTTRPLTAPALGATQLTQTVVFAAPNVSITGKPVEKLTTDDAVLVLRYVGNELVAAYRNAGFNQTGNDPITGSMSPVAKNQTLTMQVHPALAAPRLSSVRPAVTNLSMVYYLHAAPAYSYANDNGPLLNAVAVMPTDAGAISLPFGNPFEAEGWKTIVTWATSASRTYTVGTLPATLSAGMNQFVEPGPNLDLMWPAGLPTLISINGIPLTIDGMNVPIDPTKPVDLSFVPDRMGATLSQIQLYELVPNAMNNGLQYQGRLYMTGVMPHFVVPADMFQVGHTYTLRAQSTVGGYTDIATGDLTKRSLPLSQSYADSGVFTVTAP